MKKKWVTRLRNKEDVKIALICILAASVFWFFNAMNDDYTTTVTYPLEVAYNPNQIIQLRPEQQEVRVNVSGYGWQLFGKGLGLSEKICKINITDPQRQKYVTPSSLRSLLTNQIDNIQINYVESDTLFLYYDWLTTKRVNLALNAQLDQEKYALKQVIFSPNHVELTGASSQLASLDDTIHVEINQVNKGENVRDYLIDLGKYFSDSFDLSITSTTATVSLYHYQQQQVEIPISIINYGQNDINYHNYLTLSYTVREDSSHYIDNDDFDAVIDYKKIKDDSSIEIELEKKPNFIRVRKLTPQTVKFSK